MRKICYQILKDFEQNGTYLNLAIKGIDSEKYPVNQIAVRVYGIVQNNELLDYLVDELVGRVKVDKNVRLILKMQIFEYRFLNKDIHVISSEGVNLAKRYVKSASGFVNVNLRKVEMIKDLEPTFANQEKNISIKYSHPRFIVKKLMKQYPNDFEQILASNTVKKDTFVRKVKELSKPEDFTAVKEFDDLYVYQGTAIVNHDDFKQKNIIIQDLGSYLVGKLVSANAEEEVLDLCAAPGNKTMHIAKTAKLVVANELHEHRAKLIEDNKKVHNITNIQVINSDASNNQQLTEALNTAKLPQSYDKILIDAPCSGWGVIKSKPEIKYNHDQNDVEAIKNISVEIVKNSINYLKQGGQIIFSTCTLNREENDYLINELLTELNLREVKDAGLLEFTKSDIELGIMLKNYTYNSDSFYMIKLEKND
ncbi:transcription antitermination factor NusB [Mollicutes bacterium LVI A0078]|nr:transcription antitermination factor NusB [Mollicutes bacterium LVI A0075]WOO90787.1 transcription antitermination factor NusB [Mollicutes bacterium LVI A0078]